MTETAEDRKLQSRGISADMSSEAIMQRLQKVADLYEVWRWLRTAKRIGPAEQVKDPGSTAWQGRDQAATPEDQQP